MNSERPTSATTVGAVGSESDERHGSAASASPEAAANQWAHLLLGNTVISEVLSGTGEAAGTGFSALMAEDFATATAGVPGEAMSGNTAMLRVMRDSLELDEREQGAVARIGSTSGKAIPQDQLDRMNRAFGHDFSHVRVHVDGSAAQAAEALNAHAFALGADIFFGAGVWAPGTERGDRVLAHELTHVVQADEGRLSSGGGGGEEGGIQVSSPTEPIEIEAYQNENVILNTLGAVDAQITAEVRGDAPSAEAGDSAMMRDADGGVQGSANDPRVQGMIRTSRGTPLPDVVRGRLEQVLGHDFSHVRVHTDENAARAAESLSARAFALGADVFFGSNEFAPTSREGVELLAHELTHVVQHDEGRLPSAGGGMSVSSPSDSFEREADAVASQASSSLGSLSAAGVSDHAGTSTSTAQASAHDGGMALRTTDTTAPGSASGSTAKPEVLTLDLGGQVFEIRCPTDAEPDAEITTRFEATPIEGLTITEATLRLVEDYKIESGSLKGRIQIGDYVQMEDVTLVVGRDGRVDAQIRGATFNISDIVSGVIDLDIGTSGISGEADLTVEQITLQPGMTLDSATVHVVLNPDHTVAAEGTITGTVDGLGTFVLNASVAEDQFAGSFTLTLEPNLQLMDGVTIESGTFTGSYSREEGTTLGGGATVNVKDWARGTLSGSVQIPPNEAGDQATSEGAATPAATDGPAGSSAPGGAAPGSTTPGTGGGSGSGDSSGSSSGPTTAAPTSGGDVAGPEAGGSESATGTDGGDTATSGPGEGTGSGGHVALGGGNWNLGVGLDQMQDLEIGDLTISGGHLGFSIVNNELVEVSARAHYVVPMFEGDITGTYDVPGNAFSGSGSANLREPQTLGESGVTLTAAVGNVTMENNAVTQVTGTFTLELPYEGVPTFQFVASDLTYVPDQTSFSGAGTLTLMRELSFGPEDGKRVVIAEGASATGTITDNALDQVEGGLQFAITEPAGEIGVGEAGFTFVPGAGITGSLTFALTTDYGVPEREVGPFYMKEGGSITVEVADSTLTTATLADGGFYLINSGEGGEGRFDGTIGGSYDFQTGTLTSAAITVAVSERWPIPASWGEVALTEGGSASGTITNNELTELTINFPFEANVNTSGGIAILLEGNLNGDYDHTTSTFSGGLEAHLTEDVIIPVLDGDEVVVLAGSNATATVEANELTTITLDLQANYNHEGETYLEGSIDGAEYKVQEGLFSGSGTLTLVHEIQRETSDGKWGLRVLENSTVTVDVTDNNLEKISGEVFFAVDKDGEPLLDGSVTNAEIVFSPEFDISGDMMLTTARDFSYPSSGEELAAGFQFWVLAGNGTVTGRIEHSELTEATIAVNFRIDHGDPLAEGTLNGQWHLSEDTVDAQAQCALIRDLPVSELTGAEPSVEGGGPESWDVVILTGSGLNVQITGNTLETCHLEVEAKGQQAGTDVATGSLTADYALGDEGGVSGTVVFDVISRIDLGGEARFHPFIDVGTHFDATMAANALENAHGTFFLILQEEGTDKIKVSVTDGSYVNGEGITADAGIDVLGDILLAESAPYKLWMVTGTTATGHVEQNDLKTAEGTLLLGIDKDDVRIINGEFGASYDATQGTDAMIEAHGHIEVVSDIDIAGPEGYTFYIEPGTSGDAQISSSEITSITGNVEARLEDGEGAFLHASAGFTYTGGEEPLFSSSGGVEVTRRKNVGEYEEWKFDVLVGSGGNWTITDNNLISIEGSLGIMIADAAGDFIQVDLSGDYQHGPGEVTGTGSATLIRRQQVGATVGEYTFFLEPGTGGEAAITANHFDHLTGTIHASCEDEEGLFLTGDFEGTYTNTSGGEGFVDLEGDISIVREKGLPPVGDYAVALLPGTGVHALVEQNALISIDGVIHARIDKTGSEFAMLDAEGSYTPEGGFSGHGEVQLLAEVEAGEFGGYTVVIEPEGTHGEVWVEANAPVRISGAVQVRFDDPEAGQFLRVTATGDYDFTTGLFNGGGTAVVLNEKQLVGGDDLSCWIIPGTAASLTVTDNAISDVHGTVALSVRDSSEFLNLTGEFTSPDGLVYTGSGTITVTRDKQLGEGGEGYTFWLCEGGGATANVTDNELIDISGNIPLRVDDEEGELVDIQLDGTYTHATTMFDGSGSGEVVRRKEVGTAGEYHFFLMPGTGVHGTVTQNELTEVGGTLNAMVADDDGDFLSAEGEGTWTNDGGGGHFSVTGTITVIRDKKLGEASPYEFYLAEGSGATVTVVDSELTEISGEISIRVDKDGSPFATGSLNGTYTPDAGFTGHGEVELLQEVEVGTAGDYTLFIVPGTGAEIDLADNAITQIGGQINLRVDDGTTPFIAAELHGTYIPNDGGEGGMFTGGGSAEVLCEKELGTAAGQTLFLMPGTGATVEIADNELVSMGGSLIVSCRDEGGEYLQVTLSGTFDAASGMFDGTGSVVITRRKQLGPTIGGYSFWLIEGAGCDATVVQNELTEVHGSIPFEVQDEDGALLTGQADGTYDAITGMFNGTGDIHLARDVDFELGTTLIRIKAGSGGDATVTDNELRRLGGTLDAEIHTDGDPLISISAAGEFDAVEKKVVWAEGSITMLRPFMMLDNAIEVRDVTGSGRIEDNKLVRAGGGGTIVIHPLNDMTGTFNVNYRNDGSRDFYSGSGDINFTLFDDPAHGRSMSGLIHAEYNEDDSFLIDGQVMYELNEMISGQVGVRVDQTLDPIINASLNATGTLVEGRDLFRIDQDIIPEQVVPIYAGFGLTFGMAGGLGMTMNPLTFDAGIGISNWRPLQGNVPDFEASLALHWGLNFFAQLAPYMGLCFGVAGANVSAGIKGLARLDVPIEVTPSGRIWGGQDTFGGELGVGVSIHPSLALSAIPYVRATIPAIDPILHEFEPLASMTFDDLFSFEWGTTYQFGDSPRRESGGPVTDAGSPAATQTATETAARPTAGGNSGGGGGAASPSAPQMESGSEVSDQQALASGGGGGGGGPMADLMAKVDMIKVLAAGVGALADLVGLLIGCLTALTFGPIGLGLYLIWKAIIGDLSIDRLTEQVNAVITAVELAAEIIQPYLPEWLNDIINFINNPPNLWDMMFGADDAARASVRNGEWVEAVPDLQARMVEDMLDGWTGEDDQECILIILEGPNTATVVNKVGTEWILDDLDGYEDDRAREIFRQKGIAYAKTGSAAPAKPGAAMASIQASSGAPIAPDQAAQMGAALGGDVSNAQVHTDAAAQDASAALGARAFALGSDVFFGAGESPNDPALMAHELAHVVQANEGTLPGPGGGPGMDVSSPQMAAEQEADAMAGQAMAELQAPADPAMGTEEAAEAAAAEGGGEAGAAPAPAMAMAMRDPIPGASTAPAPGPAAPGTGGAAEGGSDEAKAAADRAAAQAAFRASAAPGVVGPAPALTVATTVANPMGDNAIPLPEAAPPAPPAMTGTASASAAATATSTAESTAAMAATPATVPTATGTTGAMSTFVGSPPSVQANSWSTIGPNMGSAATAEAAATAASLPQMHAVLTGGEPGEAGEVGSPPLNVSAVTPTGGPTPTAAIAPTTMPGSSNPNASAASAVSGMSSEGQAAENARMIASAISGISTRPDGVSSSPGPVPTIPLTGSADPAQITSAASGAASEAASAAAAASGAVLASPGAEQVQPLQMDEVMPIPAITPPTIEAPPPIPGIDEFKEHEIPADLQGAFDSKYGPEMQASLSSAQGAVDAAVTERDMANQAEIDRATSAAQTAVADAQREQETAVSSQRAAIESERARTISAQQAAVSDAQGRVSTEEAARRRAIDARVATDQERVRSEFAAAEADASREVARGESNAEAERQKAEREAENQSWWDRATSFVSDCINAITEAVSAIFDAVRSAVTAILDAVKSVANSIIDAAVSFVNDAIAAMGDFLKAVITDLVGAVFPELAAALCAFVDSAVSFVQEQVTRIGDKLKEAVAAACDAVAGALNAVLNAFQAGINAALAIAEGVLTGDWSGVLMKLLEAALQLAGISPDEFYAFVGRSEETIQIIIDDPGAFVGHCIDAVSKGFGQFGDNFLDHLASGFIGWLTGQAGDAGITIPATLDLSGVLDITLQVMGLTPDRLRAKAVEHLGEENVGRLEFVWGFIESAISGGLGGLMEHLQGQLDGIYDMVIGQIQSWLMEKIVIAAITKVASMFNPVGAIVQAIITAWNVYTWLKDQIQRIYGVITAVVNGIGDIARGNIDGAAGMVESALASLVPVAIDLLANLLGLGGIGAKIREIIGGIQETVNAAIDALIERVKGLFSGPPEGEAAPAEGAPVEGTEAAPAEATPAGPTAADALQLTTPFTAAGESHRVFFDTSGPTPTLMVASVVQRALDHLTMFQTRTDALPTATPADVEKKRQCNTLISQGRGVAGVAEQHAQHLAPTAGGPATAPSQTQIATPAVTNAAGTVTTDEVSVAHVFEQLFTLLATPGELAAAASLDTAIGAPAQEKAKLKTILTLESIAPAATTAPGAVDPTLRLQGHQKWRASLGDAGYFNELAAAYGQAVVSRKLVELQNDPQSASLRAGYLTDLCAQVETKVGAGAGNIDPFGLMGDTVKAKPGSYAKKGQTVQVAQKLYRAHNLNNFLKDNVEASYYIGLVNQMVADGDLTAAERTAAPPDAQHALAMEYVKKQGAFPGGTPPLKGEVSGGGASKTTWWTDGSFQEAIDAIQPATKIDEFNLMCKLGALQPSWYTGGFAEIGIQGAGISMYKPTVFDGLMSEYWVQANDHEYYGLTGCGEREWVADAINTTAIKELRVHPTGSIFDTMLAEIKGAGDVTRAPNWKGDQVPVQTNANDQAFSGFNSQVGGNEAHIRNDLSATAVTPPATPRPLDVPPAPGALTPGQVNEEISGPTRTLQATSQANNGNVGNVGTAGPLPLADLNLSFQDASGGVHHVTITGSHVVTVHSRELPLPEHTTRGGEFPDVENAAVLAGQSAAIRRLIDEAAALWAEGKTAEAEAKKAEARVLLESIKSSLSEAGHALAVEAINSGLVPVGTPVDELPAPVPEVVAPPPAVTTEVVPETDAAVTVPTTTAVLPATPEVTPAVETPQVEAAVTPATEQATPETETAVVTDPAAVETPGAAYDGPRTFDAYVAHIRARFSGELGALASAAAELNATGGEARRVEQQLVGDATRLAALKDEYERTRLDLDDEAKKKLEGRINAAQGAVDNAGSTMPQLLEKAKGLVDQIQAGGPATTQHKGDLERTMQAAMALAKQIDPEGVENGRKLYVSIDEGEHAALIRRANDAGVPAADQARLAVDYRNWLRMFFRDQVMADQTNSEILYLRDLGISGSRGGVTFDQVVNKVIGNLKRTVDETTGQAILSGDFTMGTATPEQLEAIYRGVMGSAATTNPGVNATAGVTTTTPTTEVTPVTPPAVTPPASEVTPPAVTPPTSEVTPPAAEVTPPAPVVTPVAEVTPPPAAEVTPPAAEVTPPVAEVTPAAPEETPAVTPPATTEEAPATEPALATAESDGPPPPPPPSSSSAGGGGPPPIPPVERFATDIAKADPAAVPMITAAVVAATDRIPAGDGWSTVRDGVVKADPRVADALARPVNVSHPFGQAVHGQQVAPSAQAALDATGSQRPAIDSIDTWVVRQKQEINATNAPYVASKPSLATQFFDRTAKDAATTTLGSEFSARMVEMGPDTRETSGQQDSGLHGSAEIAAAEGLAPTNGAMIDPTLVTTPQPAALSTLPDITDRSVLDERAAENEGAVVHTAPFQTKDGVTIQPSLATGSMALNPAFEAEASAFEIRLGQAAAVDGLTAARTLSAKAKAYILSKAGGAWDESNPDLKSLLEKIKAANPAMSGAVGGEMAQLVGVFDGGASLATMLTHLGNFYIQILAPDAIAMPTADFQRHCAAAELDYEAIQRRADIAKASSPTPTAWNAVVRPEGSEVQGQGNARVSRADATAPASRTLPQRGSTTPVSRPGGALTQPEFAPVARTDMTETTANLPLDDGELGVQGGDAEFVATERLRWSEGAGQWLLNEANQWVVKMREMSLPLVAGPSGTTDMLFNAATSLGGVNPYDMRLSCIGYLVGARHHSLVEVLEAARPYGAAFTASQRMYREVLPYSEPQLRRFGKDARFPDEMPPAPSAPTPVTS